MCDDTSLALVGDIKSFIFQETLSILDIILKVRNAFVDFTLCLCDRLAHLLCHESGIGRLILS